MDHVSQENPLITDSFTRSAFLNDLSSRDRFHYVDVFYDKQRICHQHVDSFLYLVEKLFHSAPTSMKMDLQKFSLQFLPPLWVALQDVHSMCEKYMDALEMQILLGNLDPEAGESGFRAGGIDYWKRLVALRKVLKLEKHHVLDFRPDSRAIVSEWEYEKGLPMRERIARLCKALEVEFHASAEIFKYKVHQCCDRACAKAEHLVVSDGDRDKHAEVLEITSTLVKQLTQIIQSLCHDVDRFYQSHVMVDEMTQTEGENNTLEKTKKLKKRCTLDNETENCKEYARDEISEGNSDAIELILQNTQSEYSCKYEKNAENEQLAKEQSASGKASAIDDNSPGEECAHCENSATCSSGEDSSPPRTIYTVSVFTFMSKILSQKQIQSTVASQMCLSLMEKTFRAVEPNRSADSPMLTLPTDEASPLSPSDEDPESPDSHATASTQSPQDPCNVTPLCKELMKSTITLYLQFFQSFLKLYKDCCIYHSIKHPGLENPFDADLLEYDELINHKIRQWVYSNGNNTTTEFEVYEKAFDCLLRSLPQPVSYFYYKTYKWSRPLLVEKKSK